MNRQSILFIGFALLSGVLAVEWFFDHFEHRVEQVEVGFLGEARRNPYLAAQRFLAKYGTQIESLTTLLDLKRMPDSNDVLFLPTTRYDLTPQKITELIDWVNQGGHLVLRARESFNAKTAIENELFDTLGVEVHRNLRPQLSGKENRALVDVYVNDQVENKQVHFYPDLWMTDKGLNELSWQVNGKNGSHLLEYAIGDGYVSLLSDIGFLENSSIGQYDHASFLYTIVHIEERKRKLWIVRDDDMPSLFSIVKQRAPAALLWFGVFIAFWLWYAMPRFGPILQSTNAVRRSLAEHITASGWF
ncbi:MAG: DUF4350 domain-containing protein, partial [Methylococcales bacterium]